MSGIPGMQGPIGRRGSVGIFAAMVASAMLGVGTLVIDQTNMYHRGLMQRQTTQAASLAGASKISTYYASGTNSNAQVLAAAQAIATANMPVDQYGTVVPASSVVLGKWDGVTSIFSPLSGGATDPNAVRVTATTTISSLLPGWSKNASRTYTTTAVASYGTGQTWNTIITNDLSGSFSGQIANQRAADKAILDCIKTSAGAASQFGITTHTGMSAIFQPLASATDTYTSLVSKINTLKSCGQTGAPACSGSNVASAIYSARMQFANPAYNNTRRNMVIITDGIPNGISRTYIREDGTYATDTAPTPICSVNCTDAQTWTMAVNQAAMAAAAGISVSTIYYSGNSGGSAGANASQLAGLRSGTGVSLVAPTATAISGVFAGFCSTMSSALKTVY